MLLRHTPAAGVAALCALLSSCTNDIIETPDTELYTRQFVKEFGVFDTAHDWNFAERASVTVRTASPTDVKIYAYVDGTLYHFGTYKDVSGAQTLSVDVPKGTSQLMVRAGGRSYTTTAGGSVSIASRSTETAPDVTVNLAGRDYWKNFSAAEILSYRETLPDTRTNIDVVTDNFVFTPTHDFIVYPIYFNTDNAPAIGIYYRPGGTTNPDEFVRYPIYNVKSNTVGEAQSYTASSGTILQKCKDTGTWIDLNYEPYTTDFKDMTDELWADYSVAHEPSSWYDREFQWWDYDTSCGWPRVLQLEWWPVLSGSESYDADATAWRSKGVEIHIEPGYTYGFYLKEQGGSIFYSETEFNETLADYDRLAARDDMTDADIEAIRTKYRTSPLPHFGIYETKGEGGEPRYVVGCEDWYASGDFDLNDTVFFIENLDPEADWPPFVPEDIDVPSYEWVVACEDLGTLDDFDFNDVVFGVGGFTLSDDGTYATVDIRALAAGGTLPVYLCLNGEQIGGEFHSWFGDTVGYSQVINAGSETQHSGKTVTVKVSPDFSMACNTVAEGGNMGGFSITVVKSGGKEVTVISAPSLDTATATEAPQMICVPSDWQWPTERTHISTAYPLFGQWVADRNNCTDWHSNPGGPVTRRHDIR